MPENVKFFLGANEDTRTEDKKKKDYFFQEIVAAATSVNWVEKDKSLWREFPAQDQDGSGSCVAQTIKKLALISLWLKEKVFVKFSATHIYQRRPNKPASGMMGVEAFELWRQGVTLDDLVPSDQLTDAQMDAMKVEKYEEDIGKVFALGGHIGLPEGDFETVASVIQQTGKGIMVWFYFTAYEWSSEIPVITDPNLTVQTGLRHSVTAVDYLLKGGKKYLLVEDSAHFGGWNYHLISEEFFKARNWFARYPMNFQFETETQLSKPSHHFVAVLGFGQNSNEIQVLQDILKYEGLFPSNTASTGYYGAITAKGVLQWQIKHNVASLEELNLLQGRRVGNKTIQALNAIYG